MPSTDLNGPYDLTKAEIDRVVTRTSPGTYALGYVNSGTFYVDYTGRSDDDVNDRLKDHIGNYTKFKFGYFSSPKAAFERECRIYHDFSPKDNTIHPDRPDGSNWACPVCDIFD